MKRTAAACALGLMLTCPLGGCDEQPAAVRTTASRAARPEAAVPDGLVAQLRIPAPRRTWAELRAAVRGPLLLLPRSMGGLLVNLLGLPLRAVGEFVEEQAIVGAVVSTAAEPGDGGAATDLGEALAVVWAVPVRDGRRFIDQASKGSEGTYRADAPSADGMTLLTRRPTATDPWGLDWTLAVVDDFAIVATSRRGARVAGAYLARNLGRGAATPRSRTDGGPDASRGRAAADVHLTIPGSRALALALPCLRRSLATLAARLPAWAADLLDGDSLGELLGLGRAHLSGAELKLRVGSEAVTLQGHLTAADAAAQAEMRALPPLGLDGLLDLPDDTLLTLTWRQQATSRARDARRSARRLGQWLATDLEAKDMAAIEAAAQTLAEGRGEATLAGVRCTGAGITGFARGTVSDASRMQRGVKTLAAYHRHPAVVARLKEANLKLSSRTRRLPDVPADVLQWSFSARAGLPPGDEQATPGADGLEVAAHPVNLLVAVGDSHFWAAGGTQAPETLRLLVKPDGERSLRNQRSMAQTLQAWTGPVWFAALADPLAMAACHAGRPGSTSPAPLLVAIGPADPAAEPGARWVARAATSLLQAAAQMAEP